MTLLQRHRWFAAAAGITLVFAGASLIARPSARLTAFSDCLILGLLLAATGIGFANALRRPGQERSFWGLMTLGFSLWACNQAAASYCEVVQHRAVPEIFFFDIILFMHAVPIIAAVAWRPDLAKKDGKFHLSLLNFMMLMGWWIFLYAFIVFPHQYIVVNSALYNDYYNQLYVLQNVLLLAVLALAAVTSSRRVAALLLAFFRPSACCTPVGSQLLYAAGRKGTYYPGSPYDIPIVATIAWMAAAVMSSREWSLESRLAPPCIRSGGGGSCRSSPC